MKENLAVMCVFRTKQRGRNKPFGRKKDIHIERDANPRTAGELCSANRSVNHTLNLA